MDANVIAAIISASGSAVVAGGGVLAQWYRHRRKRRTFRQLLTDLQEHPVLSLESDGALSISCYDDAKSGLLNSIRVRVVCEPVRQELLSLLGLLRQATVTSTLAEMETTLTRLREQLLLSQKQAMASFPSQTHEVVRKLIATHAAALATTSDVFAARYDIQQVLELIFNVFYVSTFTLLSQWGQAANQLNGQLNGLSWEGKLLEYVFQGNTTDALRILNMSVGVVRECLGEAAGFVCIIDSAGAIAAVTSGSYETLGYEAHKLTGLSLSALQLGLDGLDSNADLRALITPELEAVHMELPLRSYDGNILNVQIYVNRVRFTLPTPSHHFIAMIVGIDPQQAPDASNHDDTHTRMAFYLSALTQPTRRAVAAGSYTPDAWVKVSAVQDGAPDLPNFQVGKHLHSQMEVPSRRIEDMYSRCVLRLQTDLLRSASLSYFWRHQRITAEFFLIGAKGNEVLVSVHRPMLASDETERPRSPCGTHTRGPTRQALTLGRRHLLAFLFSSVRRRIE